MLPEQPTARTLVTGAIVVKLLYVLLLPLVLLLLSLIGSSVQDASLKIREVWDMMFGCLLDTWNMKRVLDRCYLRRQQTVIPLNCLEAVPLVTFLNLNMHVLTVSRSSFQPGHPFSVGYSTRMNRVECIHHMNTRFHTYLPLCIPDFLYNPICRASSMPMVSWRYKY